MSWQTTAPPNSVSLHRPVGEDDRLNCIGATISSPVVCIRDVPLCPGSIDSSYFEITVLEGNSVIIGLVAEFRNHDGIEGVPGRRFNSLGLFPNGDLLCSVPGAEFSLPFSNSFGQYDTVGLGVEKTPSSMRAFATYNGRDIGCILETDLIGFPLFPCIAFEEESFVVVSVKKHSPFLYSKLPPPPPPPTSASSDLKLAVKHASTAMGKKLTKFLFSSSSSSTSAATCQNSLESDLLETQEHINVLANVLSEQNEVPQRELLSELTVSCRLLLVRHQNLIRDAADQNQLKKILELNDRILELLTSADRVLDKGESVSFKMVNPEEPISLLQKGTSLKVSDSLIMLRSENIRAKKNAATCLAVFVKEELSRGMVIINGGVRCLIVQREDEELRRLSVRALAELASRIRLRENESYALLRSVFKAELLEILQGFDFLLDAGETDNALVAQAVSNLILLGVLFPVMNELGTGILLRVLKSSYLLDACRIASFGLSLLIRKGDTKTKTCALNHDVFFPILESLISNDQEDAELQLHGVSCLSALLLSNNEDGEERFTQGFIAARILHPQHQSLLMHLLALCRNPNVEFHTRVHVVNCFHSLVLHPSGLFALLDVVSCPELVKTLFTLLNFLLLNSSQTEMTRFPSSSSSKESMDQTSFFYSSRFQLFDSSLNAGEERTRMLDESDCTPYQLGERLSKTIFEVLRLVPRSVLLQLEDDQIETILLLVSKQDDCAFVDLLCLVCQKFQVLDARIIECFLNLLRRPNLQKQAIGAITELCNQSESFAEMFFVKDCASRLCQVKEHFELVPGALRPLAQVCFFTDQEALCGFQPNDGLVLPYLLRCVDQFEKHPIGATEACKVLSLAVSGRGALSVHYKAAVLKTVAHSLSLMSWRCVGMEGRRSADELFKMCGFTFGAFQLVGNEPLAIQEWASLKVDLEIYQTIWDCAQYKVIRQDSSAYDSIFFDASVNSKQQSQHVAAAGNTAAYSPFKKKSSQDLKSVVMDLKQSPPSKWIQVFAENLGHAETFERVSREMLVGESHIAKTLFMALCDPNEVKLLNVYSICLDLHLFLELKTDTTMPQSVVELDNTIHQGIGPLERYVNLSRQQLFARPCIVRRRIIRLRNRFQFWSTSLIDSVLKEESEEDVRFTLVLTCPSLASGEEKNLLVELLHANPSISSLCLMGNGVELNREEEERVAQLVGALPVSIQWLTLDHDAVSAEGLRLVQAFLGAAKSNLMGLSITQSSYTPEEFANFSRFLSGQSSIRILDLSGNMLFNDACGAIVCKSLCGKLSLTSLDLSGSGNRLGHQTLDALLLGSHVLGGDYIARDVLGEARVHEEGLLKHLLYLNLARCSLSSDCLSRLFYALSKPGSTLRVLDLSRNSVTHSKVQRAFLSFLAFNRTIREFKYEEVEFSLAEFADIEDTIIRSNPVLRYFSHSWVPSSDKLETHFMRVRKRLEGQESIELDESEDSLLGSAGEETSNVHSIHVLFASPLVCRDEMGELKPLPGLDFDSERQLLLTSLEEAREISIQCRLEMNFVVGCTTDKLLSVLTRKPICLHLSTHGEEDFIVLEDGRGGMHPLYIDRLKEICETAQVSKYLKLVFVSACSSSRFVAQTFVDAGVPNVVGVKSKISDRAAQTFTRSFYLSLALGDEIVLAFQLARQAVRTSPLLSEGEADHFVLLGHGLEAVFPKLMRNHHPPVGGTVVVSSLRKLIPNSNNNALDNFPDPVKWRLNTNSRFVEVVVPGRRVDAYVVLVALSAKRVVTVRAPEGFGKSAVISGFMCKYLNERKMYEDGAVVLDLGTCRTLADVQLKLIRFVRKSRSTSQEEDELERVLLELSKRRCLLILDHVDLVLAQCFEEFRFFWGHVLDRTKIRLLITTRNVDSLAVPGHEHFAHSLACLGGVDSAILFLKNCPHYFSDLHTRNMTLPEGFELGFARHPLMHDVRGVPKSIVMVASVISYQEWTQVVEEVTDALLPTIHDHHHPHSDWQVA